MTVDVIDLREFYATPLGRAAQESMTVALGKAITIDSDAELVGIGYPVPLFNNIDNLNQASIMLMPARQGALQWPTGAPSRTALVDEDELPIETASVDCVVVLHLIENVSEPSRVLDEIWRILVPEGKLVLIAANRRGLWTRFEHTPFGNGRPFSKGQLATLLRKAKLTPSTWGHCLNFPPARYNRLIPFYRLMDRIGHRLWPVFCGAYVVTATKRLYQGIPDGKRARKAVRVPVLAPQNARVTRRRDIKRSTYQA